MSGSSRRRRAWDDTTPATSPIEEVTLDEELNRQIARNKAIVARTLAVIAGGGVALFVVAFFAVRLFAIVILPLTAVALWYLLDADTRALRLTGATRADPTRHARLHNLTEGLCASTGLPAPGLYVLDDAAANACAIGNNPRRASIVVTTALLDRLEPIELEGLLAQQLAHIRAFDTFPASLAVVLPLLRGQLPEDREWLADRMAIEITRYPPGLVGALEKVLADLAVAGDGSGDDARGNARPAALAHLWTGPPAVASASLDTRLDALREL